MTVWLITLGIVYSLVSTCVSAGTGACFGFEEQWTACNKDIECGHVCNPRDCKWDDWTAWSDMGGCFGLCSRQRNYKQLNNECGAPCVGNKTETKECISEYFDKECNGRPTDCEFSHWQEWSVCRSSTDQKTSVRSILVHPLYKGDTCGQMGTPAVLQKTEPCNVPDLSNQSDCEFSGWTEWTDCSVSCDGGRQTRTRRVVKQAEVGAKGCSGSISETQECGKKKCAASRDCSWNHWGNWSECLCETASGPCHRFKTRSIKTMATGSGKPCNGTTRLSSGCEPGDVAPKDCTFENWGAWGECSATCGAGQKVRFRNQKTLAEDGGSCPSTLTQEISGCRTDPCLDSCQYSGWSNWTACEPACGVGLQTRSRTVTGKNCKGELQVVSGCFTDCGLVDCSFSTWGTWGECSKECGGGYHTRTRKVLQPPLHGGKNCPALELAQVDTCNDQKCTTQCVNGTFTDWSEWTSCSATCDTGYQRRSRQVDSVPNYCGYPALGDTSDVKACDHTVSCVKTQDCVLSDWNNWGTCESACFGITERNRTITQFAQGAYGKVCANTPLKEVQSCNPGPGEAVPTNCAHNPKIDCVMDDWNSWGECSATCGPGQKIRSRGIKVYPSGPGSACEKETSVTATCQLAACHVEYHCVDCKWADWSAWSQCSAACNGEKLRHRQIAAHANWCGKSCPSGAATEAAPCGTNCGPQKGFCVWEPWSATSCDFQSSDACGMKTYTRSRHVTFSATAVAGTWEGTAASCKGTEKVIEECPDSFKACTDLNAVDCSFHAWSEWTLPESCDEFAGFCKRTRSYTGPANGGKVCTGSLTDTKPCQKAECGESRDCKISTWSEWSDCNAKNANSIRQRHVVTPATNNGILCNGSLMEVKPCLSFGAAQSTNCVMGPWSKWALCSKTCVGGTQARARAVVTPSTGGGLPCTSSLQEIQACGTGSCLEADQHATNCEFSDWSPYTKVERGAGTVPQRHRTRTEKVSATNGGLACTGPLEELAPPVPVDCLISDWSDWSTCDRDCENGQKSRSRNIKTAAKYGGLACPAFLDLHEVVGCTGNLANCHDPGYTELNMWSSWSACTVTCGSGRQTRTRSIKTPGVGFPDPSEPLKESRSCMNNPVCHLGDCKWADWESWGACTKTCGAGQTRRTRKVASGAINGGVGCSASATEQIASCNDQPCHTSLCIDGAWSDWQDWGVCSASCMGGISHRTRKILQAPNYCGQPLVGLNAEMKECNKVDCSNTNCTYTDWGSWSTCSSFCDGVQSRQRSILNPGSGEGARCALPLKAVRTCNPSYENITACKEFVPIDCEFSAWSISDCSTTCKNGRGHLKKTRSVVTEARSGGLPCEGPEQIIEPCVGTTDCTFPNVDCKWGDWSKWSACDKCENGQRWRTRNIDQTPAHEGKPCEGEAIDSVEGCSSNDLCQDTTCGWGDWDDWSACSRSCKGGRKTRRRALALQRAEAVDIDVAKRERLYGTYEELRQHLDENGSRRWQDLSLAFCGGCVVFFLGALAVRKFHRHQNRPPTYRLLSRADATQEDTISH